MPVVVLKSGCVVGVVVMVVEVGEVEEEVEQVTHTGQGVEEIVDVTVEGEREDEEAMAQGKTEQKDNCDAFFFPTLPYYHAPVCSSVSKNIHACTPAWPQYHVQYYVLCIHTTHTHLIQHTHTHTHHSQHIHISHNTHTQEETRPYMYSNITCKCICSTLPFKTFLFP